MTDSFIELLMENDESKLKEWVSSYGKPKKAVSPIYFFYDLSGEDKKKEEETYDIVVKEREDYL